MTPGALPVAIVGMAVLLPGAPGLDAYWRNLRDGVDAIQDVPEGRWDADYYRPGPAPGPVAPDQVYCRRGGFVDGLAEVDVTRYGIMPAAVPGTEPDQLIALDVAAAALADAGGEARLPARHRVGVTLGRGGYLTPGLARLDQRVRTTRQLVRTLGELLPGLSTAQLDRVREAFTERLGPDSPDSAIGLVPNLAASRIANRLDLRGPAYTVDAACASSLVAVDQAVTELGTGRCDLMLAGGVHHCHDITLWSVFSQLRALSPSQRSRPFHRDADGILIGEGTGVVVLKRLADAERDGDRVYAVIRGTGVAGDGRAAGLVNPDPGGQARAVRQAWEAAGLDPAAPGSLGLLEAHGTATPAGDAAELATLAEVFGLPSAEADRAVIGSVKSMIGHTMPAAGVAGLVKAALALHHRTLLPTLHCDDPHPALAATRFRTLDRARPWAADPEQPVRRAAVNAFGFGGINAHVVLEEAPRRPAPSAAALPVAAAAAQVAEPERVLLLAAPSPDGLAALLDADDTAVLAAGLDPDRPHPAAGPARLGIVDPTARRLALARRAVAKGRAWQGRNDVWFRPGPLLDSGRLAFVFPGLEGDFSPRTDDIAAHFGLPPVSGTDARVGDVGRHGVGMVGVGRLLDRALRRTGVVPDAVAGHSVGEWTAMVAAGLYSADQVDTFLAEFDPDALSVPGLAFAALAAPAGDVRAALADAPADSGIVLSHDNAPRQSMVCGPDAAVEEFVRAFRARGVICQVLPFRSGFHTPMLAPYLGPIKAAADRFRLHPPTVPLWSGTTAAPFPAGEAEVRELFVRHLLEPVRFRELTEALYAAGHRVFIQLGPGRLTSLIGDTLGDRDHLTVAANSPYHEGMAQLRRVATALWTAGAAVAPSLRPPRATDRSGDRRPPVPLDLGGSLVSLAPSARDALRAELRPRAPGAPTPLDGLTARFPAAAELTALLRETADTAAELITAGAHRPARTPAPAEAAAPVTTTLHISPATMPHLLDHCFFPQRPGWPELEDRWPVVPATTIVRHMMDAAERAAPGLRAVAVHGARFDKWLTATPPVDVPVTVTPAAGGGPGRVTVTFGPTARADVELAPHHPAPPPPGPLPDTPERTPDHTASEIYRDRWMFHGPAFQGLTELTAIGERHVRGVVTAPAAPGALLDNVGQLLGYWIMATRTERTVVFPVQLRSMRFHGPHPAPGTEVHCVLRITALTDTVLEADAELTVAGRVWAVLTGWQDRRFDNDPTTRPVERFPDRHTLSAARPGGWTLVHERWPDLASRELIMRNALGRAERAEYAAHPPRGRRQWLLGRIAVKDAVRQWLWRHGEGPVFPAEIRVRNDASGRPYVTGAHGRTLPPLDVSLAHRAEAGVAIVRPRTGGPGPGIDVEEIAERDPATHATALGPDELRLLHTRSAAEPASRALWFTRFWAAKEAVAKAEGTGFGGRPRDFTVRETTDDGSRLLVTGRTEAAWTVHCAQVTNPPPLSDRSYVVAWTSGPAAHDGHPDAPAAAEETPR
ncbi:polyketide synthase dehydratase domain-containing protein [Streptomyces sp. LP11]|uniref:Polyketide synthase dehydratase domain-containing protein n=1 Tax=Streptomyces pyxinicus TaxID=2970331 RepID=A0ABT2AWR5_9ACTN|nr:type I polyketide synthase [Streptomyces sp. LP11]MCS0600692.1 polyketide synthase dehydratase domain-containing protein [Streptomyces sp. LP11]